MTDKELRRLRRYQLIEIIYQLQKNMKSLEDQVAFLKEQLNCRESKLSNAGSLAEVSAVINGIFEAAQNTADEYLEQIRNLKIQTENSAEANSEDETQTADLKLSDLENCLQEKKDE